MDDFPRLIEHGFPLRETSLASVHEKNVRHGHISTLHIWPARRPLAACRAALVATLLPDPGDAAKRAVIYKRLAGTIPPNATSAKEIEGGILRWGNENGPDLQWFRDEIRKAYGGRAPRVLDPFAGGGAIPLEAMRLGCETTAMDINPVAWFVLKCTLEYPQRFAGKTHPMPSLARTDDASPRPDDAIPRPDDANPRSDGASRDANQRLAGPILRGPDGSPASDAAFRSDGSPASADHAAARPHDAHARSSVATLRSGGPAPRLNVDEGRSGDLAAHVRFWGQWVLERARADLASYYPTIDGKPTVAYLWARTVKCKNCRATIPLLKTRWLCKTDNKAVALTMKPKPDGTGVDFDVAPVEKNQRARYDASGTMNSSGVQCPCCPAQMTRQELGIEGVGGRMGAVMTAVVVDGSNGKEYRIPADKERMLVDDAALQLKGAFGEIPFGLPDEPVPAGASRKSGGSAFSVVQYGMRTWSDLFNSRQLLALGTLVKHSRNARDEMRGQGYSDEWVVGVSIYLAAAIDRLLDFANCGVQFKVDAETINHSFARFALSLSWDFAEGNPIGQSAGSYLLCFERILTALDTYRGVDWPTAATIENQSAATASLTSAPFDLVITDPPYYDAIPYSDLTGL